MVLLDRTISLVVGVVTELSYGPKRYDGLIRKVIDLTRILHMRSE